MTQPYSLETILSEFSENSDAWVLQDKKSKRYVTIPHPKYPGRHPIHFFISKSDAEDVLLELIDVNAKLKNKAIYPVKVKLLSAIENISKDVNSLNADGFVVHSPNEVYAFIEERG